MVIVPLLLWIGRHFGWLHPACIITGTVIFIVSLALYKAMIQSYIGNFKNTIITPPYWGN